MTDRDSRTALWRRWLELLTMALAVAALLAVSCDDGGSSDPGDTTGDALGDTPTDGEAPDLEGDLTPDTSGTDQTEQDGTDVPGDAGPDSGAEVQDIANDTVTPPPGYTDAVCLDGWCWENPRPLASSMAEVFTLGEQAWIVTSAGGLLRWDGEDYQVEPLEEVTSVWGFAADDLWATANYELLHFDGTEWSVVEGFEGFARRVEGLSPDDLWVISGGLIQHYDGAIWSDRSPTEMWNWGDIHAIAADDVWMVGGNRMAHWDGTEWSFEDLGDQNLWLERIWMSAADDGWATGDMMGHVWRYDGSSWNDQGAWLEFPDQEIGAVWGTAPDDVWFAGGGGQLVHWDGSQWTVEARLENYGNLEAIHGQGPGDFWVVGEYGILGHYQDGEITKPGVPESLGKMDLRNLAVLPTANGYEAWAAGRSPLGGDAVIRRGPDGWWSREDVPSYLEDTTGIIAMAEDDVWIGLIRDDTAALHWDGTSWERTPIDGIENISTMCRVEGGDGWALNGEETGDKVLRYDGAQWTVDHEGIRASELACTGPGEVWAFGTDTGQYWRRSAEGWRKIGVSSWFDADIGFVAPGPAGEVWVVTASGQYSDSWLSYSSGDDWFEVALPEDTRLSAVAPFAEDSAWLAGDTGLYRVESEVVQRVDSGQGSGWVGLYALSAQEAIVVRSGMETRRWTGSEYIELSPAGDQNPVDVSFFSANVAFAATYDGVMRWDGSVWTALDAPPEYLYPDAVLALSADAVVAVGGNDAALWDGTTWASLDTTGFESGEELIDVWGTSPTDLWAVGDRGTIAHRTGAGFEPVALDPPVGKWLAVGGRAADDIWFVATSAPYHYDGISFTRHDSLRDPIVIQRVGDDLLAVDSNGGIWQEGPAGFAPIGDGSEDFDQVVDAAFSEDRVLYAIDWTGLVTWSEEAGWSEVDALDGVWWLDDGGIEATGGQVYVFSVLGTVLRLEQ